MRRLRTLLSCFALATCVSPLAASTEAVHLNFGVYSSNKPSALVRTFRPVLRQVETRMSESLGRDVQIRMQIAKEYDEGITALTSGRFDFSRFGPSSYIEAKRANQDIRIIAMENNDDAKVFYGIIAVHAESDIESIEQLRGRTFAFGDEGSTIGRFLSQLHLEQAGIRALDLADYQYLGRHDLVGTAVGAGDFDAGALNESTFKKLVAAGTKIRELTRFPNVTKPWIARSGLDPEIYDALRDALLAIDDLDMLAGLKIDGFLAGDDDDYQVIRRAMDDNYLFFSKPAVEQATVAGLAAQALPPAPLTADTTPALLGASVSASPVSHAIDADGALSITINLPRSLLAGQSPNARGLRHLTINLAVPDDLPSLGGAVPSAVDGHAAPPTDR